MFSEYSIHVGDKASLTSRYNHVCNDRTVTIWPTWQEEYGILSIRVNLSRDRLIELRKLLDDGLEALDAKFADVPPSELVVTHYDDRTSNIAAPAKCKLTDADREAHEARVKAGVLSLPDRFEQE